MKHLTNYHQLSEILNFDLYLTATVIAHFKGDCIDDIFVKLQNLNIEEYQDSINQALDLPIAELKLLSENYEFKSQTSYINYLTSLLDLNNVEYIDFRIKEQKKISKYITNTLF